MQGIERLDVGNPWWMNLLSFGLAIGYFVIGTIVFFGIFALVSKWREKKDTPLRAFLEGTCAVMVMLYMVGAFVGQMVMTSHGPDIYGWAIGQKAQDEKVRPVIEKMGNFFHKEYLSAQIGEKKVKVGDEIPFTIMVTNLKPHAVSAKQSQAKIRTGWTVTGYLPENPNKVIVVRLDVDNNLKDPEVNKLLQVNFTLEGKFFGEGYVRTRSYLTK